jgi:hypothetical protein
MSLPAYKKIRSPDRVVTQLQDNVEQAIRPLLGMQIAAGRLIENVEVLTGTPKVIDHRLNRAMRGWFIVDKDADANVWKTVSTIPERTLVLNSSANVTLSLWVF